MPVLDRPRTVSLMDLMDLNLDDLREANPNATGVLAIQDPNEGDLTFSWDKSCPEEVEICKEAFHNAKNNGYIAYRTDNKKEIMDDFDIDAQHIVMAMPMVGG